jgi:hypothetical protein
MIGAFWRLPKHQWLYFNSLDSLARLRTLVAFHVEQHNTQMPHAAFWGQTPDEMYFGTAANLPSAGGQIGMFPYAAGRTTTDIPYRLERHESRKGTCSWTISQILRASIFQ